MTAAERFEEALAEFEGHEHEYGVCDGGTNEVWENCPKRTAVRAAHAEAVEEARREIFVHGCGHAVSAIHYRYYKGSWASCEYRRGLREGAERERGACAALVDKWEADIRAICPNMAAAIRARSGK